MENSLIISFNYGRSSLGPLFDLEEQVRAVIEKRQLGEYDGHIIAVDSSDGALFMYGDDPERIYKAIEPILLKSSFMRGAEVSMQIERADQKRNRLFTLKKRKTKGKR